MNYQPLTTQAAALCRSFSDTYAAQEPSAAGFYAAWRAAWASYQALRTACPPCEPGDPGDPPPA